MINSSITQNETCIGKEKSKGFSKGINREKSTYKKKLNSDV